MVTQTKPAPVQIDDNDSEEVKALKRQLQALGKENTDLAAKQAAKQLGKGTITVKVVPREKVIREVKENGKTTKVEKEEGGNLRTYGLQKWPITLFAAQQDRYDSPEVMAMRCQAIVDNIDLLVFDESTPTLNEQMKAQVLRNAKVRLAFLATFDDFAAKFKG